MEYQMLKVANYLKNRLQIGAARKQHQLVCPEHAALAGERDVHQFRLLLDLLELGADAALEVAPLQTEQILAGRRRRAQRLVDVHHGRAPNSSCPDGLLLAARTLVQRYHSGPFLPSRITIRQQQQHTTQSMMMMDNQNTPVLFLSHSKTVIFPASHTRWTNFMFRPNPVDQLREPGAKY